MNIFKKGKKLSEKTIPELEEEVRANRVILKGLFILTVIGAFWMLGTDLFFLHKIRDQTMIGLGMMCGATMLILYIVHYLEIEIRFRRLENETPN